MDQVAELVEQGDDVGVLHQAAREVADEHALGELTVGQPTDQVELCRVLELALARVQVEVDPAEVPVAVGEEHVVRGDRLVPEHGVLGGPVGQPEQPAGDLEQAAAHRGEVEVGAHLLGVDV